MDMRQWKCGVVSALVLGALGGCGDDTHAITDASVINVNCDAHFLIEVPSLATFNEIATQTPTIAADTQTGVSVDLSECTSQRWSVSLALGSAWGLVHPRIDGMCELWLGGETENPMYDGHPTQYCLFARAGGVKVSFGGGGPATLNDTHCVSL